MDKIIEIKFKTVKFEILIKLPFIGYLNHLFILIRIRDMARNTPAVLHSACVYMWLELRWANGGKPTLSYIGSTLAGYLGSHEKGYSSVD